MQGDVFTGIALPDYDDDEQPPYIQIVMHPCNMDIAGGRLRKRIVVSPVNSTTRLGDSAWLSRKKAMPLPSLLGAGKGDFLTDLTERISVRSSSLDLSHRVAALSDDGILLLQQRLIMCDTRLAAKLSALHEENRSVFAETELQEEWLDIALDGVPEGLLNSTRISAGEEFQDWLDQEIVLETPSEADAEPAEATKTTRRATLKTVSSHSSLRRDMYREARFRYKS